MAITSLKAKLKKYITETGTISFNSTAIPTISATTSFTSSESIVNKAYVDQKANDAAVGITVLAPAEAATTVNIDLSSPGFTSLDGVALSSGNRILVKDQTTKSDNGIYVYTGVTSALARATDANTPAKLKTAFILVNAGVTNVKTGFKLSVELNAGVTDITTADFTGVDSITASAMTSASSYVGTDSNITITGNKIDLATISGLTAPTSDTLYKFKFDTHGRITSVTEATNDYATKDHTHTYKSLTAGTGIASFTYNNSADVTISVDTAKVPVLASAPTSAGIMYYDPTATDKWGVKNFFTSTTVEQDRGINVCVGVISTNPLQFSTNGNIYTQNVSGISTLHLLTDRILARMLSPTTATATDAFLTIDNDGFITKSVLPLPTVASNGGLSLTSNAFSIKLDESAVTGSAATSGLSTSANGLKIDATRVPVLNAAASGTGYVYYSASGWVLNTPSSGSTIAGLTSAAGGNITSFTFGNTNDTSIRFLASTYITTIDLFNTFTGAINIASNTVSSGIRTINIGANGSAGSTTNVNINSPLATSTTTINGIVKLPTVYFDTTVAARFVKIGTDGRLSADSTSYIPAPTSPAANSYLQYTSSGWAAVAAPTGGTAGITISDNSASTSAIPILFNAAASPATSTVSNSNNLTFNPSTSTLKLNSLTLTPDNPTTVTGVYSLALSQSGAANNGTKLIIKPNSTTGTANNGLLILTSNNQSTPYLHIQNRTSAGDFEIFAGSTSTSTIANIRMSVGATSGGVYIDSSNNITLGLAASTTTINGIVKLPTVYGATATAATRFVKIASDGTLSPDASSYIPAPTASPGQYLQYSSTGSWVAAAAPTGGTAGITIANDTASTSAIPILFNAATTATSVSNSNNLTFTPSTSTLKLTGSTVAIESGTANSTVSLFSTNAATINIGISTTTTNLYGTLKVNDVDAKSGSVAVNLFNTTNTTTINAFGGGTGTKTINIGTGGTGTTSITLGSTTTTSTTTINGNLTTTGNLIFGGTGQQLIQSDFSNSTVASRTFFVSANIGTNNITMIGTAPPDNTSTTKASGIICFANPPTGSSGTVSASSYVQLKCENGLAQLIADNTGTPGATGTNITTKLQIGVAGKAAAIVVDTAGAVTIGLSTSSTTTINGTVTAASFNNITGLAASSSTNGNGTATTVARSDHTHSITFTGDVTGSGTTSIALTLATINQSTTGSFLKISVDTKGRVIGSTNVVASDLTTLLGTIYSPLAGSTSLTTAGALTATGLTVNGNTTLGSSASASTTTINGITKVVGNKLWLASSTSTYASLNIPTGMIVTAPIAGDVYTDALGQILYYQNASNTKAIIPLLSSPTATTVGLLKAQFNPTSGVGVVWSLDTNTYVTSSHTHPYAGSATAGGAATSVANALSFSSAGGGNTAAYDGSAARTISYNSIGAFPTTGGSISGATSFGSTISVAGTSTLGGTATFNSDLTVTSGLFKVGASTISGSAAGATSLAGNLILNGSGQRLIQSDFSNGTHSNRTFFVSNNPNTIHYTMLAVAPPDNITTSVRTSGIICYANPPTNINSTANVNTSSFIQLKCENGLAQLVADNTGTPGTVVTNPTNITTKLQIGVAGKATAIVVDTAGRVGINNAGPTAQLDVNGTLNVSGASTLSSLTVSGASVIPNLVTTVTTAPTGTTAPITGSFLQYMATTPTILYVFIPNVGWKKITIA